MTSPHCHFFLWPSWSMHGWIQNILKGGAYHCHWPGVSSYLTLTPIIQGNTRELGREQIHGRRTGLFPLILPLSPADPGEPSSQTAAPCSTGQEQLWSFPFTWVSWGQWQQQQKRGTSASLHPYCICSWVGCIIIWCIIIQAKKNILSSLKWNIQNFNSARNVQISAYPSASEPNIFNCSFSWNCVSNSHSDQFLWHKRWNMIKVVFVSLYTCTGLDSVFTSK